MKTAMQAIQTAGIQKQLAYALAKQSKDWGIGIALRAPAEPTQRYDEIHVPKGIHIKAKTSNWGPVRGHIPVNDQLSRVDQQGHALGLGHRNSLGPTPYYTVQEQKSLRQLIHRLNHDYEIRSYDPELGKLTFALKSTQSHRNQSFNGQFCLFLSEGMSNVVPEARRYVRDTDRPEDGEQTQYLAQLQAITQGTWDEQRFGPIEATFNKRYPLYLDVKSSGAEPEPVLIYADEHKRPIASDWDLLWVCLPIGISAAPDAMLSDLAKPIDTQSPENKAHLNQFEQTFIDTLASNSTLSPKAAANLQKALQDSPSSTYLGILNPWEFFHLLEGNLAYRDDYADHFLQHGPENRTPAQPQSLNSPCLHFVNGDIILTENEQELLDLVQNQGKFAESPYEFLAHNQLDVHPTWRCSEHGAQANRWEAIAQQQRQALSADTMPPNIPSSRQTALDAESNLNLVNEPNLTIPLERFQLSKNLDFLECHPTPLTLEQRQHLENMLLSRITHHEENQG